MTLHVICRVAKLQAPPSFLQRCILKESMAWRTTMDGTGKDLSSFGSYVYYARLHGR